MIKLAGLNEAIDPATGRVTLSVPLASLPDTFGPTFGLAATYASPTHAAIHAWNLSHPTGVLGLGWNLGLMRVLACNACDGTAGPGSDRPTYLLDMGASVVKLLRLGTAPDGAETYGRIDGAFWVIRFYPDAQRWQVIDANGTTYGFGRFGSSNAVATAVAWGSWAGASKAVEGQSAVPVAWHVARIQDLWGNRVELDYTQVLSTVGSGLDTYTQAIYLNSVTGAAGGRLLLHYAEKEAQEYQPAHTMPAPPNAWQSVYETKYLEAIEVLAPADGRLQEISFSYGLLGSGERCKRLLHGIRSGASGSGSTIPGINFVYGESSGDLSHGQLMQVTLPEGGVGVFSYESVSPAFSDRSAVLQAPTGGVTYSNPSLTLGDDYAVAVWTATNDSQVAVTACTWDGRWVPATLDTISTTAAGAVQVATGPTSFAVCVNGNLYAYQRNPAMCGAWTSSGTACTLPLVSGEQVAVACVDGAAAAFGLTGLHFSALIWTGSSWRAQPVQTLAGGGSSPVAAIGASDAQIVTAITDGSISSAPVSISVMGMSVLRQWTSRSVTLARPSASVQSLTVQVGATFAVTRSVGVAGTLSVVTFDLVDWSGPRLRTQQLTQLYLSAGTPLPSASIHGCSIVIGQLVVRFDGVRWNVQDLDSTLPEGASALTAISPGVDMLVRSFSDASGGSIFDVIAYDPNAANAGAAWSSSLAGTVPAGAYAARAALSGTALSNYIVCPRPAGQGGNAAPANALYYRMPNGQWSHALDIPDAISPANLPSLQLIGERYLVYQSDTGVIAYSLASGGVEAASRTLLSNQTLIADPTNPTLLMAPQFFATYTGVWGETPTISLHYVTRSGASGLQPVTVVSKLRKLPGNTVDPTTGYPATDLVATYEPASALASTDGAFARCNRCSLGEIAVATGESNGAVQTELFNGLTDTELASLAGGAAPNYPAGDSTNAREFTRLLAGTVYRTTASWLSKNTPQTSVRTTFVNVIARALPADGGAGNPVGYRATVPQAQNTQDGVTTTVNATFNANLLPQTISSSQYDGNGNVEATVTTLSYFPDQYAASGAENLLTPVISSQTTTNGVAVAASATTWTNVWGMSTASWAPLQNFVANAPGFAAFNAWAGGATPAGWQGMGRVVARAANGAPAVMEDAFGRPTMNVFDANDARVVATFKNAGPAEAGYYGFEPYERSGGWSYFGSTSIQSHITTAQYHTGSRSLCLLPNGAMKSGPIFNLLLPADGASYVFSCWMLVPAGFVPDAANACWALQVYDSKATAIGAALVVPFPAASSRWQYVQAVVDVVQICAGAGVTPSAPLSLTIFGYDNRAPGVPVYVDELCICPLESVFAATVFDLAKGYTVASLGANGATWRAVRHGDGQIRALVGPSERNVAGISLFAYARAMSPDGTFQPAFPNQSLRIASASFGRYENFDAAHADEWTLPPDWSIANRRLAFNGSSSDVIGSCAQLNGFSHSNYAALVRVPRPAQDTEVSIGTGDVFVTWRPVTSGGTWLLRQNVGGEWQTIESHAADYSEQWLFAVVDDVVFFFAGGAQVLGWRRDTPTQGKLQLAARATAVFEELVVAVDPSLAVTFIDGGGATLATMAMADSDTVEVSGPLFDSFGRAAYEREPVLQTLVLGTPPTPLMADSAVPGTGLNRGALTTYLPYLLSGSQMTLQEYLNPLISNAPYSQTVFESSPLGRPVEIGFPGKDYTIGSGHTTRIQYGTNAAGDWLSRVLPRNAPGLASGSYFRSSVTTPDGHVVQSVTNRTGQLIATALIPACETDPMSIESFSYDGNGRQVLHRLPNFYSAPGVSANTTWVRSATYDFAGNLTSSTDPDRGTTLYLSDSVGRPRFSMDAAGAAQNPQVARYICYDSLDRGIEKGTFPLQGLAWSGLVAHVDDPGWPGVGQGAIWSSRPIYDRPATAGAYTPQPPNLVGRLAQLQINSTGAANPAATAVDTYSYSYDLSGNVVEQQTYAPGFDTTTRQSQFAWDNLGRKIEVTYPRPLDSKTGKPQGKDTTVTYFYDRIGRIAGIGSAPEGTEVLDPSNPHPGPMARYAYYQYDDAGRMQQVTHGLNSPTPITQQADYDAAGRLSRLTGDYFSQTITYGTGGLASSTDWSGRATSITTSYAAQRGDVLDPLSAILGTRTWLYRYDPAGRLTGAVASDSNIDSSLTAGTATVPITYDADGSLLTVPRGVTVETYAYAAGSPPQQTNHRVQQISVGINQTLNFAGPLPDGWSFGASNEGPTTSQLITPAAGGTPYFQLGGGSLGHYEWLRFTGLLGLAETYTLTITWSAPAPFASQPGIASCDLVLTPAQGVPYRKKLQDFSGGSPSLQTSTISIDMAAATAAAGLAGSVVSVSLEFRNAKRGPGGTSGGALQIQAVTLTRAANSPTPSSYVYDAAGRMIQATSRALTSIEYDPMSGRVRTLAFSSGQAVSSVALTRGPQDRPATRTVSYSNGAIVKSLELRAPDGGLLATETQHPSGATRIVRQLRGVDDTLGLLPSQPGEPELYFIRDRLGSLRVVAAAGDDASSGFGQRLDYGPFGEVIFAAGDSPSHERFTGQSWNLESGLGDYVARLYDPGLRIFLQPDPALFTANPYSYCAGDPVNRLDPSGELPEWVKYPFWFLVVAFNVRNIWETLRAAWEQPASAAANVTVFATSQLALGAVSMATSRFTSPIANFARWTIHEKIGIWTCIPIMRWGIFTLRGMLTAGWYELFQSAYDYVWRGTRQGMSLLEWGTSAVSAAWNAKYSSIASVLYGELAAPRIMFPKIGNNGALEWIRGTSGGPAFVSRVDAKGNTWDLFLSSNGIYAFEEFAEGFGFVMPWMQKGNAGMRHDTHWALWLTWPSQWAQGWRYEPDNIYRTAGWVLEHRTLPGYYLIMTEQVHSLVNHIGVSTFINGGTVYEWLAYDQLCQGIDTINARTQAVERTFADVWNFMTSQQAHEEQL